MGQTITTTLSFRSAYFLGKCHLAGQAVELRPLKDDWLPRYHFTVYRLGVRIGLVVSPKDARLPGGVPRFARRARGAPPVRPGRGGCATVLRIGPPGQQRFKPPLCDESCAPPRVQPGP